MIPARKYDLVSPADYLASELESDIKHEYLGGVVYAIAGSRNAHNLISTNFLALMHAGLHGSPCEVYGSDTKIRIQLPTHVRFYYPGGSVVCEPNPQDETFQDHPVVVAEVLSPGTRRIDEGEKREAYLTIPSLRVYLLIEQEAPAATVFRRTEQGFVREIYEGLEAMVPLPEVDCQLPLSGLYERVKFLPESDG